MKWAAICIMSVWWPATLLASDPPVVQALRQDLVGKRFSLKLSVAGNTCLYDPALRASTSRLVDTELSEYGGVRYFLRADRFMNIKRCEPSLGAVQDTTLSGIYIDSRHIGTMHPPGEVMVVKLVEAKPDRVEVQLTPDGIFSGDMSYAKIKLVLGKGYENSTIEQIERVLARALYIPRLDSIAADEARVTAIRTEINHLQEELAQPLAAKDRLGMANHLIELYQQEPDLIRQLNTVAFSQMGIPDNSERMATAEKVAADAGHQIERERIDAARTHYSSALAAMTGACAQVHDTPVTNQAGLNAQIDAVSSARLAASKFDDARKELLSLAQPVPNDGGAYGRCIASCDDLSKTFDDKAAAVAKAEAARTDLERKREEAVAEAEKEKEQAEQIAELNREYASLKKQRAALDAKVASALGSPDEDQVFSEYRALLEQMIRNRREVSSLGDNAAVNEEKVLLAQLHKLG